MVAQGQQKQEDHRRRPGELDHPEHAHAIRDHRLKTDRVSTGIRHYRLHAVQARVDLIQFPDRAEAGEQSLLQRQAERR